LYMGVAPRLTPDSFAMVERALSVLTGYLGNGLYTLAGALLVWAGARELPRRLILLSLPVWCAGIGLSAASLLGSAAGQIVAVAAVRAGAHWLDIADDAAWISGLLADTRLAGASVAVGPGLSTVPALSGALVGWCRTRTPGAMHAQVTLFIGNRNAKGGGALA